ncbi:scyllo-inositol 2-dehydrogenase (NAD(+))-like isoform 3-T3 [Leptodactylus fuscus]|uniref:scyllo-inositol 2-dehydrogenase (NAD(+))-like isoform X3 n=1 Tax=Leptodactylus fuscus TaxID=238119 RepID=UPI003F4E8533
MDFFNKVFRSSKRNPKPDSSALDPTELYDFDTPRPDVGDVKCITVLMVGAGSRGMCYTYYAVNFPKRLKIVGVADPLSPAKETIKMMHRIDEDKYFDDWREAAKLEKFADAVIIATPDKLHKDPAIAFAKKGYHILLEKPMAVTPEDCCEIVNACKENGVILAVGHVMRYHPVSRKVKELLDSGVIGDIVHIQHMEPLNFGWPVSVVCSNGVYDIESLTDALKTGPYGRCVYECDNDVASNQVVNMEFQGGQTAAFTMMAFTNAMGARRTTIYGTKGELQVIGGGPIKVFDFVTNKETQHVAKTVAFMPMQLRAHGGADYYLINSFISAVSDNDPSLIISGPDDTLQSHLLVFQAEKSRRENRVVLIDKDGQ